MKKYIILVFLFITFYCSAQFNGELNYKVTFDIQIPESFKKMGVTKETILNKIKQEGSFGDSIKTIYKNGDYITYTSFQPIKCAIYKKSENKLYSFETEGENANICAVRDCSSDTEEKMFGKKPTILKLDSIVDINNIKCNIVRVKWKTGTYDYYYNSEKLKIDYSLYSQHIYDGFADFLRISNSLPIRIVKYSPLIGNIIFTLSSEKQYNVDDKIFDIPKLVSDPDLNIVKLPNVEIFKIKK